MKVQQQNYSLSIAIILKQYTDATLSPNTQELLKVMCVIPLESLEAENTTGFGNPK